MQNLIYLLVFIFISCTSYGQGTTEKTLLISDSLLEHHSYDVSEKYLLEEISKTSNLEAQFLFYSQLCWFSKSKNKIDKTLEYGQITILDKYSEFRNLEAYGDALYNLSVAQFRRGVIDSTFYYAEKALETRKLNLDPNHHKIVQNISALGIFHSNVGNTELSIEFQEQALAIALKAKPRNYNSLVGSYFSLGSAYQSSNQLYKAKEIYDTALNFYKTNLVTDTKYKGHIYNAIGIILESQKDFQSSQEYYKEAAVLMSETDDIFSTTTIYSNLANNYTNLGKYTTAKKIHKKVIALIEGGGYENELPWKYLNLGATYMECLQYDSALVSLDKAYNLNEKVSRGWNELTTVILNHYADTHMKLDQFDQAETYLKKSIIIAQSLFGLKDLDLAESYYLLAKNYYKQGEKKKALKELQKGENALILTNSPDLNYTEEIISRTLLLDLYILKEKIFWSEYQESNNIEYLNSLYNTSINANRLSDAIINYYEHENAKLNIFNAINESLFLGIKASKELYDLTGEQKYIEQALTFFESEKSFLLKQEYKDLQAKNTNQVSDSLLQREDQLKREISQNQNLLFSENNPDSEFSKELSSTIFESKRALSDLLQELELNNPVYFTQKYEKLNFNTQNIRSELTEKELFIEYFQYQNEVFSISVSENHTGFTVTYFTELEGKVQSYNESLLSSDINTYSELAHTFYTKLIEKHITNDSINHITIVPSKSISFLSFDSFLTEKPTDLSYNKLSYLIQDKSISYKNSLQKTYTHNGKSEGLYVGISPEFSGKELGSLKGASQEVKYISTQFNGLVLKSKLNLKDKVLSSISNYKIIHFATHAILNTQNSSYSSLLLGSDTLDDKSKLHAYEIQNTKLNADLVVLSACNTGIGELKKGEGLASLARSFNYAGAKSVLVGLWALPDMSTSIIIKDFFFELTQNNKAVALRNAKASYIDNADEHTANPMFWAGLILIGEKTRLDLELPGNNKPIYLGGICLLLVLSYLVRKKLF